MSAVGTVYAKLARIETIALKIAHSHFLPLHALHAIFPTEFNLIYRLLSMTLTFLNLASEFTTATQTSRSIQLLEVTKMQKLEIGHSLLQRALQPLIGHISLMNLETFPSLLDPRVHSTLLLLKG
jgi:hypothetical protein